MSSRALCATVIVCAFGIMALLTGCQDYNPNLGASASLSSEIGLIVPSSRNAGCSGFTLDVLGGGFIDGSSVQWNGQNLPTVFETSSELLATVPQANLAMQNTPATALITVSVPGQTQGNDQSNTEVFTVNPPTTGTCPASLVFRPTIASSSGQAGLSPSSGSVGTTVTIAGTYFGGDQGASTVAFAGPSGTGTVPATIAATSDWSATSITTTVPTGAVSGAVIVTVGGLASNSNVIFTVISAGDIQAPTASNISKPVLYAGVSNPVSASTGARYIAFVATSADPSTAGNAGVQQVYLRDTCIRATGSCTPQTILVSAGLGGAQPNGPSWAPTVSSDGRFVAFASNATNFVGHDDNRVADIFLRDTCLGVASGCLPTTTRVSVGPAELEANGASSSPSISADGRYVAFNSVARNLTLDAAVASSANSVTTFLRDTCLGAAGQCTPSTTRQATSTAPAQ